MTVYSSASDKTPLAIGAAVAIVFHILLLVAFALLHFNVAPMISPPMEVELLGAFFGEEEEESRTPEETETATMPTLPTRRVEPAAPSLPQLHDESLLPDLPPTSIHEKPELSAPPLFAPDMREGLRSPADRLSPLAVAGSDTAPSTSQVKVKVEGMLSSRRLVHMVNPLFPTGAGGGGVVKVRLIVGRDGTVRSATIVQKAYPALERAGIQALKQWRFAPSPEDRASTGVVTVEFVVH